MKKYPGTILIVDDDEHVLLTSSMILKSHFDKIETLTSPKTLETRLKQNDVEVLLLDMNFLAGITTGNEGIFWMNRTRQLSPHTQVVLQTAYSDIEMAVKSIKEGAVDYLPKPWDKEKLVSTMINAYQQAMARRENHELRSRQRAFQEHLNSRHTTVVSEAPSMKPVLHSIEMVAPTDANVLILGENGTGKELVAQTIHGRSIRAHEPFISVDMGAITTSLFESELFGHVRGAFTDAKETRIGKFELANRGTLLLDEIGNLPSDLQAKLLTFVQTRTIYKVGSNLPVKLDVRLICATNVALQEAVQNGKFRQDLYYRLRTVEIQLPPLRERKEDVPILIQHYLDVYTRRYNKKVEVSENVMRQLMTYSWPGNVRELQHAVERAVILSQQSSLSLSDFQLITDHHRHTDPDGSLNLNTVERQVIREAILKYSGNLTKAAEELGIGRTTLYRKMEEYGIS